MVARAKNKDKDFEEVEIGLDVPIYTTGVVCDVLEIPIWILKQLDTEEVVCPPRKTEVSSRMYSKRELKKVQHCWFYMNEHNVKIAGLKVILEMQAGTFDLL